MSLSKDVVCKFCQSEKAIYTCPKCSSKYCSSECFKHEQHLQCSEIFFQNWVTSSLQNRCTSEEGKNRMLEILKRSAEQETKLEEDDELSFIARFADVDLSKDVDETMLWERLTDIEKDEFNSLLKDQKLGCFITVKQPWWVVSEVNLVEEIPTDSPQHCVQNIAVRPDLPIEIRKLSTLTSTPPSDCIKYNVINIIYSYAFLMRLYNCDLRDFVEDVVESILYLSPVLSEKNIYTSLEQAVQDSIMHLMNSKFDVSLTMMKSVVHDVFSIINGPNNAQSNCYVLCCLSDLRMLMWEFRKLSKNRTNSCNTKKGLKKAACMAIQKIEYLISWSVDYYASVKDISSMLKTMFLPDLIDDMFGAVDQSDTLHTNSKLFANKTLIQEID